MSIRLPDVPALSDNVLYEYLIDLVRTLQNELNRVKSDRDVLLNRLTMGFSSHVSSGNADPDNSVILVDSSASAVLVSLPDPLGVKGRVFNVKKIDSNTNQITIECATAGITIDGVVSVAINGSAKSCITCYSDGSNYWII